MKMLVMFLLGCGVMLGKELVYEAAPVGNPLKGLVPYESAGGKDRFPHSMEFRYFALKDLMKGWGKYDWEPMEKVLEEARRRGKQMVVRVYAEYPGKGVQVPGFLVKEGVKVTEWTGEGLGEGSAHTPDYGNAKMRRAMGEFIGAFGKKYDGDARVGFVTAGILGLWGEWHTYPRDDLWASKEVQVEVMEAFEKAFVKTKVLLRYPANEETYWHASNAKRGFGYHDDSFGWATLETGREKDAWFFVPTLRETGVAEKWREVPIGGEIRPELWKTIFTGVKHEREQDFGKCVEETHASWLMDSGLFDERIPMDEKRKERALKAVGKLGYELFVKEVVMEGDELVVRVENRGVAPFYYDWPVEVRWSAPEVRTRPMFPKWKLSKVLPGEPVEWRMKLGGKPSEVRLRVANPMEGGRALGFANAESDGEWVVVGL